MSIPFDPVKYLHQPYEVSIETMTLCNAACSFCTYPALERRGTTMTNELMIKLVLEMATFEEPFFFSPFKVNEPFLDKRTIILCQLMNTHAPLARLRLFTNGTPLTETLIEQINKLQNVEHLWVSLNSTNPEEYNELMKLPFEKTAKKLDLLHESEFKHDVVLSRVESSNSLANFSFVFYCQHRWPKFKPTVIKRDGWLGDIDAPNVAVPNTPCVRWWELSIMSTGVVSLCCMDGTGKYSIGDVSVSSLLSVYNSPEYLERREKRLTRKTVEPCARCSY